MTAFAFGCTVCEEMKDRISQLLSEDDGTLNLEGDLANVPEPDFTLLDTLTFSKVTQGFTKSLALILDATTECPLCVDKPSVKLRMPDGAYRLYIFNDSDIKYHRAFVKADSEIDDVKIVSKFPILPPRYMDVSTNRQVCLYAGEVKVKKGFEVKIQPAGVTIVDVYMK